MAQLHVQKKRSQNGWLIILIVLVLLAIAYYVLVQNNILPDTFNLKSATALLMQADKNYLTV